MPETEELYEIFIERDGKRCHVMKLIVEGPLSKPNDKWKRNAAANYGEPIQDALVAWSNGELEPDHHEPVTMKLVKFEPISKTA